MQKIIRRSANINLAQLDENDLPMFLLKLTIRVRAWYLVGIDIEGLERVPVGSEKVFFKVTSNF